MSYKPITEYEAIKSALLHLIYHYENNDLSYLARADRNLTVDELQEIHEYNNDMLDRFQQALMLLEAKKVLNLID